MNGVEMEKLVERLEEGAKKMGLTNLACDLMQAAALIRRLVMLEKRIRVLWENF